MYHNWSRNLSGFRMTVADPVADASDASPCVEQAAGAGLHVHIMVHNRQAPKNLSSYKVHAVSPFSEMSDAPVDMLARWQDRFSIFSPFSRYSIQELHDHADHQSYLSSFELITTRRGIQTGDCTVPNLS